MKEKFLTRGEDSFNLAPYKYPWAAAMCKQSRMNGWNPEEVPMGADKACHAGLSPDEAHMFKHVFATLTTSDMAIGANLAERVYPAVKAAEVRAYIARQIAEEELHSESYQHVLEVLGVDQEETYTLYQRAPEIKGWFDLGREAQDTDLLHFLVFYYCIWEGVFFMTGFAPIYSLQRRNLMTGTGAQLQYIQRDEAMHVAFGIKLINEIRKEEGDSLNPSILRGWFTRSLDALERWAGYCVPPVLGYSAETHVEHARYLADRRLKQLGFAPLFDAQEALPWLDEQTGGLRKEKNFFESRVAEYRTGAGLDFDGAGGMDGVLDWRVG